MKLLLALLTATLALPSSALAARDFQLRYGATEPGAITIAANTLMSCPDIDPGCAAARAGARVNDNAFAMAPVDVDGDPGTVNSSRARLALPPGAEVLHAGLYWGADRSAGARGARAPQGGGVRLQGPGDTRYRPVSPVVVDTVGQRYQGVADVTGVVRAAGSGEYTVAGVDAGTGEDRYAGWALVVAYRDAAAPVRNLAIFDGFTTVNADVGRVDIPVTGFGTPATGPVRTEVGFVAYEGDRATTGDGATLAGTALGNAAKAPNNLFDSTIGGVGRTPEYANQLGFDAFTLRADGALANGATSTTLGLTTRGETYLPGVVTLATDLYESPAEDGGDDAPPTGGGDDAPPVGGDGDVPPMGGGGDAPPSGGGDDVPPTGAGDNDAPPTAGGDAAVSPRAEAGDSAPLAGVAQTACPRDVLRLVDVRAAGPRRVFLAGQTAPAHAGRNVTLLAGDRALTTATVRADGSFQATTPRIAARYQATLDGLRSPRLKLTRRMDMTRITSRAGTVTLEGRVRVPLTDPAATVTVREYSDCRGRDSRVVRSGIPVSPSGRFRVTLEAPADARVVYYRALTRVRRTRSNPTTYPTFTLLRGTSVVR